MAPSLHPRKAAIAVFLLLFACTFRSLAQFPTAASYPFTASQKVYNYLAGGTQVTNWTLVTAVPLDDAYATIPLGFTFTFAGTPYTSVIAHTNGYMIFGTTNSSTWPPYGPLSVPCMMAGWDDCQGDPSTSTVTYSTTGVAPNRVFTLEFKNWGLWDIATYTPFISYQYIVYESGPMELLYKQEGGTSHFGSNIYNCAAGISKSSSDYQSLNDFTANPTPSTSTFTLNLTGKPATGQSYLWGQVPCTGTPTTSVAGPNVVCYNKPFALSLNGLSIYSGLTFQWQTSTNGTSWANYTGPGATSVTMTDVLTAPKWYRCIVTCTNSSQSFTTAPHLVSPAPFYLCYCDGSKATGTGGVDIGNVSVTALPTQESLMNNGGLISFLNNPSANNSYTDYRLALPPVPMYVDSVYTISLSQINATSTFTKAMAAVYIDFDRNGKFDPAERVLLDSTQQLPPVYGTVRDTFTVPKNAGYGLTGMRVILVAGSANPDTCAPYGNGETEDYLVELRYTPCSSAHAGTVMGDTSMCNGYDYVVLDSTYQKKRHGLSHSWQESPDGINWVDIPGSDNKDTLIRLFDTQPMYYRLTQVCSYVNDTDRVVHRVNIKPGYKCYCFSQSLGGDKDTSDVGGFAIYNFEVTDGGAHLINPRAIRKRQDYTDLPPIEMWVDSVYEFRVFHTMPTGFHSDAKVTVFMDLDNDGIYEAPGERVFTGFTSIGTHTLIKNMIIPDSVIVDVPTGMRVIVNNDVSPNIPSDEACGMYTSGETEDYMMIFRRAFPAGVQEVKGIEDVQLFPNPTSGKFTIHFRSGNAVKEVKIKVLSMTGQMVMQDVSSHGGGRFMKEIDLGNYAKGIYLVELDADGIKSTNRVVVR